MAYDTALPKQTIPHNLDAEAAVLGAILFDNEVWWRVCEIVRPEDFYSIAHKWLFRRIGMLIDGGQTADGITLQDKADKSEEMGTVGGAEYLFKLLDVAPMGVEAVDYARMIAELGARRAILQAAEALREKVHIPVGECSSVELLGEARALLEKIEERAVVARNSVAQDADATFAEGRGAVVMPSGWSSLDRELGGFERGAVSLIAARPGVGKTGTGLCLSAHVAKGGESVGFFSLDMTGIVSRQRLAFYLAYLAGEEIPFFSEMRKPNSPWITQEFRQRMAGHLKGEIGQRIFMYSKGGIDTKSLAYQVRAWKRHCVSQGLPPLGMVLVDHIGKISPSQAYRGLYEKTSYASNEVLEAAKQHEDVAFVCLAQLNRVAAVDGRRPGMSDIRDSGKLEEDASAIVLLHREDLYLSQIAKNQSLPERDRDKAAEELTRVRGHIEFIIGKNRNGEVGAVTLRHTIGKNIIRDADRNNPQPEHQETML
jgi:replicative DNA helicase